MQLLEKFQAIWSMTQRAESGTPWVVFRLVGGRFIFYKEEWIFITNLDLNHNWLLR